MYVIGEVTQGSLFAVASVLRRAKKDFNFYVEYEAFMKDRTTLVEEEVMGWIDSLGEMVEQTPENEAEYLALSHKQQQAIDFQFTGDAMPSHAGLEFIRQRFPNLMDFVDHYGAVVLVANLNFETPIGQVHDVLEQLGQKTEEPNVRGALTELVTAICLPKAAEEQARVIAQHGYAISPVSASGPEGMNRVYTIAGRQKFGFELFCVQGHADLDLLCSLIGCIIALHQDGTPILEVNGTIAKMADGTAMRYRIVEADPEATQALGHFGDFQPGDRLIQCVFADNNNLLPGEEGYNDEHFKQPVFALDAVEPVFDKEALAEAFEEKKDE